MTARPSSSHLRQPALLPFPGIPIPSLHGASLPSCSAATTGNGELKHCFSPPGVALDVLPDPAPGPQSLIFLKA